MQLRIKFESRITESRDPLIRTIAGRDIDISIAVNSRPASAHPDSTRAWENRIQTIQIRTGIENAHLCKRLRIVGEQPPIPTIPKCYNHNYIRLNQCRALQTSVR